MTPVTGAVRHMLRDGRVVGLHGAMVEIGVAAGRLFLARGATRSDDLARLALAMCYGGSQKTWWIERSFAGAPQGRAGDGRVVPISLSRAAGWHGVLVGRESVGLDLETLDRIARETQSDDDWLDAGERALLETLDVSAQRIETACRWMLREAYGKALGRGLAAWSAEHRIAVEPDGIRVRYAADLPMTFDLIRHGPLLIALAASGRQPVRAGRQEAAEAVL